MMPTGWLGIGWLGLGWLGLGCALLSAAGVAILAATDPKRRRERRRAAWSRARRLVALAVLAPGIALGSAGLWVEFLIWVGAAAVLGWAIAAMSNVPWWRRRRGEG